MKFDVVGHRRIRSFEQSHKYDFLEFSAARTRKKFEGIHDGKKQVALRELAALRALLRSKASKTEAEARTAGLLLLGVDLTSAVFNDDDGCTLLMLACEHGFKQLCGHLCGAPVSIAGGRRAYLDARKMKFDIEGSEVASNRTNTTSLSSLRHEQERSLRAYMTARSRPWRPFAQCAESCSASFSRAFGKLRGSTDFGPTGIVSSHHEH